MKLNLTRWLAPLTLFLALLAAPLQAQPQGNYKGLDVVFLIDQSGSMGGKAYSPTESTFANDPNGIRFQATQFGVDWLGNFRAQQASFGINLDINTAVVYFGDNANVQLPLTPLAPGNLDDWQTTRSDMLKPLSSDTYNKNLGNTDFINAFDEAFGLFPHDQNRLQAIILLTDGTPCAPHRTSEPTFNKLDCSSPRDWSPHMQKVAADAQSQFHGANQHIYAIAMIDSSAWAALHGNWELVANQGFAEQLQRPEQFGVTFNGILTSLAQQITSSQNEGLQLGLDAGLKKLQLNQQEMLAANGVSTYAVPPYQQLMTISLFKSRSDTKLILTDPAGNPVVSDNNIVKVFGASSADASASSQKSFIEIWQIADPMPGDWKFGTIYTENGHELADGNASATLDLLRGRFQFIETVETTNAAMRPVTLAVEVRDAQDHLLNLGSSRYDISGTVTVTTADGKNSLELPLKPAGGEGRSTVSFTPWASDEYTAQVTTNVDGLSLSAVKFNVNPTQVSIDGVQNSLLELTDQHYTLHFVGLGGKDVPGITVENFQITMVPATATCDQPGAQVERLPDPTDNNDLLTINAQHHTIGDDQWMCVQVVVQDDAPLNGSPTSRTIFNGPYQRVSVRPVQPIVFRMIRPEAIEVGATGSLSTTTYRPLLPVFDQLIHNPDWQTRPLDIAIEVLDKATHTPLKDINDKIDPTRFFSVEVLDHNDTNILGKEIYLTPTTGDPSHWTASLDPLPEGDYRLVIHAPSQPIGDTDRALLSSDNAMTVKLSVSENTSAKITQALIGLGALALVALLATAFVARPIYIRRSPVKGTLSIVRRAPNGNLYMMRQQFNFDKNRYHKVHVALRDLPVVRPPLTGMFLDGENNGAVTIHYELNGIEKKKTVNAGEMIALDFTDSEGNEYHFVRDQFIKDGLTWAEQTRGAGEVRA